MMQLCPPAAAISSPRLTDSCPFTSAKSIGYFTFSEKNEDSSITAGESSLTFDNVKQLAVANGNVHTTIVTEDGKIINDLNFKTN